VVRVIENGDAITLAIDGESVALGAEEVLASAVQREGYAAMAGDGYLVALDTELTRELVAERLAREVIRRVNDWRKAAGLNIDDRIAVQYAASPDLEEAIALHREYIMAETLAISFEAGSPDGSGFDASDSFVGESLRVELKQASVAGATSPG
jgi:isoleucyl-tRNA synthetase